MAKLLSSMASRPGRIIPGMVLVILLYLMYLSWSLNYWSAPAFRFAPHDATYAEKKYNEAAEASPGAASDPDAPKIWTDAHKIATADDFLLHFKKVLELAPVSMAEAKSGCTWAKEEHVNFQYGADAEWAANDRNDTELSFRRKQWHDFVDHEMLPYAPYKDHFKGRGITIVAGNNISMKRVRVILKALKALGSKLAVEIQYWDDEMTWEEQKNISTLWPEIYFNDLSAPHNIIKSTRGILINYQLKTAAVINSRFAEPLLLDSDNIPTVDPASLYESTVYKEYGTLFWPDIARTRVNNPMWAITNTKCRMDEFEQESGQLVVDKRKYFYHLQLAAWFNNAHTLYYGEFLLGDKDTFRFAWHALKTKFGFPPRWVTSVGTVSADGFYCGHSFAQHHPNGSVAFLHGGLIKAMAPEVMRWQREKNGGIFQVYKRSKWDEQHSMHEETEIKWDGGDYLPNKPADLHVGSCTDMKNVTPKPLDDLLPGFGKKFEQYGGYWMLDEEDDEKRKEARKKTASSKGKRAMKKWPKRN